MLWLIPALLAPALWAASNIIDSKLVNRDMKSITALVMFTGPFMLVPFLAIVALGRFEWPGAVVAGAALLAGLLGEYLLLPYFKALTIATTSDVVLMFNLTPIFVAVAARAAIGEHLTPIEYGAIMLLVGSSLLAGYRGGKRMRPDRAFFWMLLATVLFAATVILEKFVYQRVGFSTGYGWVALGAVVGASALAVFSRSGRAALKARLKGKTAAIMAGNEGIDLVAGVSASSAMSLGPVSLVRAVGGIQPLLVLFFATIFHVREQPKKEESSRIRWIRTTLAVTLAAIGLALLRYTA